MSQASDYAARVSDILQTKANAIAEGKRTSGAILGNTIATLGQVVPQQVQAAMHAAAQKRKEAQIQGIFQKYPNDLNAAIQEIMPLDQKLGMDLMERSEIADKHKLEYEQVHQKAEAAKQEVALRPFLNARNEDDWVQAQLNDNRAGLNTPYAKIPWSDDLPKRILMDQMAPKDRYEALYGTPKPVGGQWLETTQDGVAGRVYKTDVPDTFVPAAPPKASDLPKPGTIEDYFPTYARDIAHKPVDQLTAAEKEDARGRFLKSDDRPRITVNTGGGSERLTTDAIADTATRYRILGTGAIPTRIEGPERVRIMNEASKQQRALGQSAAQAVQKQAAFKSDASALTQMQKMAASADAFETKALAQADLISSLSAKVPRTASPMFNKWILSGKTQVIGDRDTALLFNALDTFTTEYAKIMSGSTGSVAAPTEAATKKAEGLISAAMNKGTLQATVDQMKWEMDQTNKGYAAAIEHITDRMGGAPTAAPAPVVTTPAAGTTPALEELERRRRARK